MTILGSTSVYRGSWPEGGTPATVESLSWLQKKGDVHRGHDGRYYQNLRVPVDGFGLLPGHEVRNLRDAVTVFYSRLPAIVQAWWYGHQVTLPSPSAAISNSFITAVLAPNMMQHLVYFEIAARASGVVKLSDETLFAQAGESESQWRKRLDKTHAADLVERVCASVRQELEMDGN